MDDNKKGDYIINLKDVSKTFANGVTGLSGVSADVERAEVLVVIGPSGSGNSGTFSPGAGAV